VDSGEKCGALTIINYLLTGSVLDVACMSPDDTNRFIDEYEQEVDEIIATCRGDLRSAVKALLLINERLEQTLRELSALLIERTDEDRRPRLLH
jgi:hypothetical protein